MVTVLTRTIGPSGRDYASFTLAEADVENIGTSADLVANDEAIVFEADAGTYDGLIFAWTLTTDATRNVTFKPASGSDHEGVFGAGVILQDNITVTSYIAMMLNASTNHCVFDGIAFNVRSGVTSACSAIRSGVGHIWRNCLFSSEGTGSLNRSEDGFSSGSSAAPIVYENCVTKGNAAYSFNSNKTGSSMRFVNCTHLTSERMFDFYTYAASSQAVEIVNCINLGGGSSLRDAGPTATTVTGSNNFGGSTDPFPAAIQGSPYPITASTAYDPGAGDFALYVGKNGALLDSPNNDVIDQGVGPSANSDVPTTDILGNARSGATANPGAFEVPQATTVLTRTIGSGRDYASFTLAEADVTNIGTSADLLNENEAIVFEADAATYSESVTFNSTLTTDATRNVTYKPAAGSEHGGVLGAGVHINSASQAAVVYDSHIHFTGLSIQGSSYSLYVVSSSAGVTIDSCIHKSASSIGVLITGGSASAYTVLRNCCVLPCPGSHGLVTQGSACYARIINFTLLDTASLQSGSSVELINFWTTDAVSVSGTIGSISGSNNFAPSGIPSGMQGSPYPITAATDPEQPQAGDYAIHDSNGRLYNVTTNDVWQAGIGPASNSDVPTTDILGATRSGTTANPGAFELGVGESNEPPALPGLANATPDFRVHLDRRVTDATTGVSSTYDASTNTTTFTLPYKLNTAATMQVVTRKTSGANAGQSLTVVSTDATNRRVVVSGNHTGTAVFIGEKYTMKYQFSELHLQRNKNTYAAEPITAASHRVRYGRVNYGQTSFFKVTVTPKGGTSSTYVFNGNLLNEPETQLGSVALYDGHFQFPVLADHDRVTIELENDSPLPSRFLSCEWESFYHSRIGSRSRY